MKRYSYILGTLVLLFTLFSITVGYFQKKEKHAEFIKFNQSQNESLMQVQIKDLYLEVSNISSNRIPGLIMQDSENRRYHISLSSFSNEQLISLSLLKFQKAKLKYYKFKEDKCLYSITQGDLTLIQPTPITDKVQSFDYFGNYSFRCETI